MLLDIITKLKLKNQICIILFYYEYSFIFCSYKPFEEELTTRKNSNKKIEMNKLETNKQNSEQKKKENKDINNKSIEDHIEDSEESTEDTEEFTGEFTGEPIKESVEDHIEEPINKSTGEPTGESIEKSIEKSTGESTGKFTGEPIKEYIEDHINKPIVESNVESTEEFTEEFTEKSTVESTGKFTEESTGDSSAKDKISDINTKLKDTLDSLNFPGISENLEIYKNIFNDILKKCREKVLFLCNKNIFTNIEKLKEYDKSYIKIANFYNIIDIDPKNNFKINTDNIYVESCVDEDSDFGTEIFIIKDPVYNFIYSIRCYVEEKGKEEKKELEDIKDLYLKNNNDKDIYLCDNTLYFYLNEEEEENNKEKIQPSKYLIFFKYISSLLDESGVYCSQIADVKSDKFFIENKIGMDVLTSVGYNRKNPLIIKADTKITRGIKDNKN